MDVESTNLHFIVFRLNRIYIRLAILRDEPQEYILKSKTILLVIFLFIQRVEVQNDRHHKRNRIFPHLRQAFAPDIRCRDQWRGLFVSLEG